MRVSVIIPTLEEDAALKGLLARIGQLDPPADELIVVDGMAAESCQLVCRNAGALWIPAHPGRGGQLALGAACAQSEVLWFLHPGCEPPLAAVGTIRRSLAEGAVGGYFRFRFAGPATPFKRLLERCIAWRCRWGMARGDQGLFATRAAYAATPGFAVQPLFEEAALVQALKRTRRFVALSLPVTVSPERWERDGYLRRVLIDRLLALGFSFGISPARLARWRGGRLPQAIVRQGRSSGFSRSGGHEARKGS